MGWNIRNNRRRSSVVGRRQKLMAQTSQAGIYRRQRKMLYAVGGFGQQLRTNDQRRFPPSIVFWAKKPPRVPIGAIWKALLLMSRSRTGRRRRRMRAAAWLR